MFVWSTLILRVHSLLRTPVDLCGLVECKSHLRWAICKPSRQFTWWCFTPPSRNNFTVNTFCFSFWILNADCPLEFRFGIIPLKSAFCLSPRHVVAQGLPSQWNSYDLDDLFNNLKRKVIAYDQIRFTSYGFCSFCRRPNFGFMFLPKIVSTERPYRSAWWNGAGRRLAAWICVNKF